MVIELYGHPFASFAWKALVAAYARGVPFEFRMVDADHPANQKRIAELSPTGQFPALVDGERAFAQSNVVIEYLDGIGDAPPLIPRDRDAALQARILAEVFDDYVDVPMQRIVAEALRDSSDKDPRGVANARATLDRSYAWLGPRITGRWAAGDAFTIANCAAAGARFYADWVHPIPPGSLKDYRARLLAHPPVERVVDEARPYRPLFALSAPDRD